MLLFLCIIMYKHSVDSNRFSKMQCSTLFFKISYAPHGNSIDSRKMSQILGYFKQAFSKYFWWTRYKCALWKISARRLFLFLESTLTYLQAIIFRGDWFVHRNLRGIQIIFKGMSLLSKKIPLKLIKFVIEISQG